MPFRVKVGLSVVVTLVIIAGYFHQGSLGHEGPQWALLFLGHFMLVALWIFPDVTRKPIEDAKKASETLPKGT